MTNRHPRPLHCSIATVTLFLALCAAMVPQPVAGWAPALSPRDPLPGLGIDPAPLGGARTTLAYAVALYQMRSPVGVLRPRATYVAPWALLPAAGFVRPPQPTFPYQQSINILRRVECINARNRAVAARLPWYVGVPQRAWPEDLAGVCPSMLDDPWPPR